MSMQDYPCAECPNVIAIGDGKGLCDYSDSVGEKFTIDLFAVFPYCPKPKPKEEKHD